MKRDQHKDLGQSVLLLFLALCCCEISAAATHNETSIPVVKDVIAIASANPKQAAVFWTPLADNRVSMYRVYYKTNSTQSQEMQIDVVRIANSALIEELEIRQHYIFTVAVGYLIDGQIVFGPRSPITVNSNVTTGLSANIQSSNGGDMNIAAISFYGGMLVLSMVINLVLLTMSYMLLRQLRQRCHMVSNNTSVDDPTELKVISTRYALQDHDVPRRPAREHLPTKEALNELFDGKCSPAKEADEEV